MNWKKPFLLSKKAPRTNLRENLKERILKGVIRKVNASGTGSGTILVLDELSSQVIGRFLTIPELSQEGVLSIENLNRKRKKFQNLNGVYLISPSLANFRRINEDFNERTYKSLHICTTRPINEDVFRKLATLDMVSSIRTLKELNLEFFLHSLSAFR